MQKHAPLLNLLLIAVAFNFNAAHAEIIPYDKPAEVGPAETYAFDGTNVDVDMSQYAGYAGLIVANGGLKGSESSYLYTKHKIKLNIVLKEESDWSKVQSGKFALAATTADVLAAYRNRLNTEVIGLIAYSRGADEVIAKKEVRSVRDLVGKTVLTGMFDESEFFIRKLCDDNSLKVHVRNTLEDPQKSDAVNMLFSSSTDEVPEMFSTLLLDPKSGVAACVGWLPFTADAVEKSKGEAYIMTTNKNQLFIADVLIGNQGFCNQHPEAVKAIIDGMLYGNLQVKKMLATSKGNEEEWKLVCKELTTDPEDPYDQESLGEEMRLLEFSSARMNQEFLSNTTRVGAGFDDIFKTASRFYGAEVAGAEKNFQFISPSTVECYTSSSYYEEAEKPVAAVGDSEKQKLSEPTVKRDFKFRFALGVYDKFELERGTNEADFDILKQAIKERPGSIIKIVGHLDNSKVAENGPEFGQKYAANAKESSLQRADTIEKLLMSTLSVEANRIEAIGLGWEHPVSKIPAENARVEVEIFVLE